MELLVPLHDKKSSVLPAQVLHPLSSLEEEKGVRIARLSLPDLSDVVYSWEEMFRAVSRPTQNACILIHGESRDGSGCARNSASTGGVAGLRRMGCARGFERNMRIRVRR